MCLMSLIFYLCSRYCCFLCRSFFFHIPHCWRALVLSLISAHYGICSQHILNVAVIIKRAAVKVQLVFMLHGPLN